MRKKWKNLFLMFLCGVFLFGCATSRLPSNKILATSSYKPSLVENVSAKQPVNVAVFLPLSGRFATSGNVIRDGFLTAHYYAKQRNQAAAQVNFFDTNKTDARTLYQQAVLQGADFVVGPLTKADVVALASLNQLTKPVLALNTISDQQKSQANFYQFGLSPQDEAMQIAYKILHDGRKNALIIAPLSDWDNELVNTFKSNFEHMGGVVVDSLRYDARTDLSKALSAFLRVVDQKQLGVVTIKEKEEPKPIDVALYRRTDFDVIFLIAKPETARQIRPLLKFYYAGDVPVYATSLVYSGTSNPQLDFDLDGIIFCDLPWILEDVSSLPPYIQSAKQQIAEVLPNSSAQSGKLYALGIDAYNLMRFLNVNGVFPNNGLAGATGVLFLDHYNHIYRRLDWAKIHNGKPEFLKVDEK
jgi:uncharacterized protein